MIDCPVCKTKLEAAHLHCRGCNLKVEGHFRFPRLMRLKDEHIRLAEAFVLSGGNLKALAQELDISYPTLRKRIDEMVEALRVLRAEDDEAALAILKEIEGGKLSAEEGTRRIKEMNGEL